MIALHERTATIVAARRFTEWASLYSEGLFMMLQVYADESGTNDINGQKPGSSVPTFCGYIDTPEYWLDFCRKWKKVLNNYRAPFFHFREFANKHEIAKPDSPYYGWSEAKRH